MADTPRKTLADLIAVMAALRHPETGCPWDLEQDFATIAPYTLEEAYEVVDAIARNDRVDLKEELGDLLLQVVYHAQLASEEGSFGFEDVAHGITTKMIRRHPHVFGDEAARTAGAAKGAWERIKAEEKAQKAAERARVDAADRRPAAGPRGTDQPSHGLLDDVPVAMPGLTRAVKLQDKAARVGFDWPDSSHVLAKLREELAEFEEVVAAPATPRARLEDELGDILFVIANVARHLKLDPEAALRSTNDKFRRRFQVIEHELARRGKTPAQSTLEEMDAIWTAAKAREKDNGP